MLSNRFIFTYTAAQDTERKRWLLCLRRLAVSGCAAKLELSHRHVMVPQITAVQPRLLLSRGRRRRGASGLPRARMARPTTPTSFSPSADEGLSSRMPPSAIDRGESWGTRRTTCASSLRSTGGFATGIPPRSPSPRCGPRNGPAWRASGPTSAAATSAAASSAMGLV